jgi:hypothetical protein
MMHHHGAVILMLMNIRYSPSQMILAIKFIMVPPDDGQGTVTGFLVTYKLENSADYVKAGGGLNASAVGVDVPDLSGMPAIWP